ncbi:MAG: YggS family pyridoxal phosphate-dependent enzyme [Pseudomonadota bacterium]|nr:YggS family pyridoxal phosphate-dependent enzyme [Pseudomonadota bacterium]
MRLFSSAELPYYAFMIDIAASLAHLTARINAAAVVAGRDPGSVQLIAVSKTKSQTDVEAALAAGQRAFGENRVQEAKQKFAPLKAAWPDLVLHLIGPLQTNKAEEAVQLFDVIETVDRPRIASALSAALRKTGRRPQFYIEVNTGGEPQKAGVAPGAFGEFLAFCRGDCGLTITGVMGLPPQHEDPSPHFRQLYELAQGHNLPHVSMGMSGDFEAAIACGATDIRLGTALFGPRIKAVS